MVKEAIGILIFKYSEFSACIDSKKLGIETSSYEDSKPQFLRSTHLSTIAHSNLVTNVANYALTLHLLFRE